MNPTVSGPRIDIIFAIVFVSPINEPAKFGDKSMWFTIYPTYVVPLNPTAIVSKIIATVEWLANGKISKAVAGIQCPIELNNLRLARVDM